MSNLRIPVLVAAFAATLATPGAAIAPGLGVDGSSTTIGISGFVPVICHARVSAAAAPTTSGKTSLGQLREFCNSPHGYRVVANYSPSLHQAKLIVDGKPVPFTKDGITVVSRSNRPAIGKRSLELELAKNSEAGSISFRIEPL